MQLRSAAAAARSAARSLAAIASTNDRLCTLTLASFSSAFSLSTCFLPFHSSAHFLPSLVSLSLPFWSGDLRCFRRPLAAQCIVAKTYKNSQVGPLVIFTLARYAVALLAKNVRIAASGTFTPCPTNKCSRGSSVVGLANNKMDDALRETMTWSSAPRARWTITIRWMDDNDTKKGSRRWA